MGVDGADTGNAGTEGHHETAPVCSSLTTSHPVFVVLLEIHGGVHSFCASDSIAHEGTFFFAAQKYGPKETAPEKGSVRVFFVHCSDKAGHHIQMFSCWGAGCC